MPEALAVDVENLAVTIKQKHILKGLDLRVEQGSFHGVIGPNGAGKTTLFDTVLGFRQPTSGRVSLLGQPPHPRRPELLARVGIQPQKTAFFTKTRLIEHLQAVADIFGASRSSVGTLVEALDLTAAAKTKVENLSGGERQRLHVMNRTIVTSAQTCARLTGQVGSRQALDHRDRKVFEEGSPHVGCGEQRIVSTG